MTPRIAKPVHECCPAAAILRVVRIKGDWCWQLIGMDMRPLRYMARFCPFCAERLPVTVKTELRLVK